MVKRCLAICCCLLLAITGVWSQDIEKLKSEREKSLKEIAMAEELLQQTRTNRESQLQNLKLINRNVTQRERVIRGINNEIRQLNTMIRQNETTRIELENEIARLKEEYSRIIYRTFLNRNSYHRAQFIFAASDFNQALKRLKYLEEYGKFRKQQGELILQRTLELKEVIAQLESNKGQKNSLLTAENREVGKMYGERKQKDALVKNLQSRERQLKKELDDKRLAYKRLESEIARIIAAATGSEFASSGMRMTPEMKILSNEFSQNEGGLPWPVERGVITLSYGVQDHPVLRNVKIDNKGIEILTEPAAPVRAIFNGTVAGVLTLPGGNRAVLIQHGEYFSVYQNLSDIAVKEGDQVKVKQVIGKSYKPASVANSEIHFEIWKSANPLPVTLDPEKWLSK